MAQPVLKKQKREGKSQQVALTFGGSNEDVPTPKDIYESIVEEFGEFDKELNKKTIFDPCPLNGRQLAKENPEKDGLFTPWKTTNFVNPPFHECEIWLKKAINEYSKGNKSVFLLVARTNTNYWRDYVVPYASEIRFFVGRMKFYEDIPGEKKNPGLPIAVCLVVFDPSKGTCFHTGTFGNYDYWASIIRPVQ